jgi:hypothetical protein
VAERHREPDFVRYAAKIIGSSMDECEAAMREALAEKVSVARSQPYYLDVTAPDVDKATVVDVIFQSASCSTRSHCRAGRYGKRSRDVRRPVDCHGKCKHRGEAAGELRYRLE